MTATHTAVQARPGEPVRKTDVLIQHMRDGDWTKALSLANTFRKLFTKQQKRDVERAHGMLTNPRFYTQMGYDRDATIAAGRDALIAVYGDRI